MKLFKRILLLLIPLMSLVACGNSNNNDSTNDINKTETWTVTLDLNYEGGGVFKTFEVDRTRTGVGLKDYLDEKPTREGYTFDDWYHDKYCKVPWLVYNDKVRADTTLYANWETSSSTIVEKATIQWTNDASFSYQAVDGSSLPTQVDLGTSVSFKINISDGYVGTPIVQVNDNVLTPSSGQVYIFEADEQTMTVSVSGLSLGQSVTDTTFKVDFYYTIPEWNPVVTNPKIYYWGKDRSGSLFSNEVAWDNAEDTQGSMEFVSGNDYMFSVELDNEYTIEGVIAIMYQNGIKKQSIDLEVSINETCAYDIYFVGDPWTNDIFNATISMR